MKPFARTVIVAAFALRWGAQWYEAYTSKDKVRIIREVTAMVLGRPPKMCNFIEWRDKKIVYKRYASLFFISCIDKEDNEASSRVDIIRTHLIRHATHSSSPSK